LKAYKYKIRRPSKRIVSEFEQILGLCRELYNAALQERREAWRICRKSVSNFDQNRQLKEIRKERPDIGQFYAMVFEECLRRVSHTYNAFFLRCKKGQTAGFPRFKGRDRYNSFTYRQWGYKLQGNKLILSKLGSVRLHLSRPIKGIIKNVTIKRIIKNVTIKRQADEWFAILTVEENQSPWYPRTGDSVGIDVGIENLATLSTGEVIENPQYLRASERRLKIAQRKVSKKTLHGANRQKARKITARIHQKIANQRRDFFHKAANGIIRDFDEIAVEDLNIKGMVKNHHLAKSISDAAWNTFITILTLKAESAGRRVWKVPAAFTSQDCSRCGNRVKKSLAVREHRCIACGFVAHRDHNAAINILARAEPSVRVNVVTL
jgi:putative transposase